MLVAKNRLSGSRIRDLGVENDSLGFIASSTSSVDFTLCLIVFWSLWTFGPFWEGNPILWVLNSRFGR